MLSGDDGEERDAATVSMIRSAERERRALIVGCGRCADDGVAGTAALVDWRQERTETPW